MAGKDDRFEFNAPKFVDFMNDCFDSPDDSYFETEQKTEQTEDNQTEQNLVKEQIDAEEKMDHEEQEQSEQPAAQPATPSAPQGEAVKKRRQLGSVGVRQSPRLAAISKALRRSNASRGSLGNTQSNQSHVKKVKAKKMVRRVSNVSSLTKEDKEELATLATFRDKMTANKKKNNNNNNNQPFRPTKPHEFHFATDQRLRRHPTEDPTPAPPPPPPPRTRTGTTKPHEFTFATDARLKGKEQGKGDAEEPVEFVKSLRSSSMTSLNKECGGGGGKGPTIPQPFKLSESRKPQEEPKKFVSMAELNNKFYVQTPERFRTTKRNAISNSTDDVNEAKKPRGCTIPHTPNLTTSRRRRSLSLMTYEEREQQAFEEAQKHAFKANPVNKKVLQTPPTGYKVKKLPTVPEPFMITETKKYQPSLLPEDLTDELGEDANLSMASLPYSGMAIKSKRHTTKIQPFSFDSRDKTKLMMKQEKIKKVIEEEKRLAEFHAQPMPVFEDGVHGVPPKKPPTPTQLRPFNLHVDQRGSLKQEKFKQQLEEEAHAEEIRRKFHAQSDEVVHKKPFIPEKSTKPLTEISNITLSTEVRASERNEYDLQRKALEEEMLAAKKMEEERRAAEELVEVARLRREAVHKAQPVPKIKPMLIHPAPNPPTVPKSPNFATESRLRSRQQTANTTISSSNSNSNSTFSLQF